MQIIFNYLHRAGKKKKKGEKEEKRKDFHTLTFWIFCYNHDRHRVSEREKVTHITH